MSDARREILARVSAVRTRSATDAPPRAEARPTAPREDVPSDPAARIARFQQRLAEVGATSRVLRQDESLAPALADALASHGARTATLSDAAVLRPVADSLRAKGIGLVDCHDRDALLDCDAGITTAQWAVADTGTLVLVGDDERHRLASLLPRVHACVVPRQCIVGGLRDAFAELGSRPRGPGRIVTFVTGPSRTADIELTLVVGVHGPAALHLVIS